MDIIILSMVIIGLVIIGLLLAMLAYYKKSGKKYETDYYMFFMMGIIFTGAGIPMMAALKSSFPFGSPLFAMGIIYLAIGLANRDKWKDSPSYKRRLLK